MIYINRVCYIRIPIQAMYTSCALMCRQTCTNCGEQPIVQQQPIVQPIPRPVIYTQPTTVSSSLGVSENLLSAEQLPIDWNTVTNTDNGNDLFSLHVA